MLYSKCGKRFFDLALALPALILLSPLLAWIALLVRLKLGSPVLFTQVRPGLQGKPFTLYKYRTMNDACDANGHLLPDAKRLTPFGRLLRSTSLDELPELFNILRGDMSLVGPRPLLMRYYPYFTKKERARFHARPGITGWAQTHGRSNVPWSDRFMMDVWYVERLSFRIDLYIILLTLKRVFARQDITAQRDNPRLKFDLDVERSMPQKEIEPND